MSDDQRLLGIARACFARGPVKAQDSNGREYLAYEYVSERGNKTHIDAELVEFVDNPVQLIAMEIAALLDAEQYA